MPTLLALHAMSIPSPRVDTRQGTLQASPQTHLEQELRRMQEQLAATQRQLRRVTQDLTAAEMLMQSVVPVGQMEALRQRVGGRRLLYVGARPSGERQMRALIDAHGGQFEAVLAGVGRFELLIDQHLARVDWVLMPVDCLGPEATQSLHRHCTRRGLQFSAPRTSSLIALVSSLLSEGPVGEMPTLGACLRA